MIARTPIRRLPLSSQILDILIEKIRDGVYSPESLLPTENQLAAEYQVSRATIRSAFDRMEALGLIYRKQGVGTFARRASSLSNPLNQFVDFYALIRENGCKPGFEQLSAALVFPSNEISQNLQLEPDQRILEVHKVFYADKAPIIFCINSIPEWVFNSRFSDVELLKPDLIEPQFINFFAEKCGQPLKYFISKVQADLARNAPLPGLFSRIDPLTPTLIIEEVGYNESDQPIVQSTEYHPGNWMQFKLIRSPWI
ncbi:MAG TPA: GntR family transcriptional regulator [Anaerolineales bacterium]|nr:GntR family transcriptional regulator [Anaerolineales bacterium]